MARVEKGKGKKPEDRRDEKVICNNSQCEMKRNCEQSREQKCCPAPGEREIDHLFIWIK